jgi:hypothetical protein
MRVDRVIVLSILIALTQGFLLVIDPASGPFSNLVAQPYQLPLTMLLLAALVTITAGIADATLRSHPQIYLLKLPVVRLGGQRFEFAPFSWILPSLLVVGTYLFLRLFDNYPVQIVGTIISSLALIVVIIAQYYTVGRQERLYGWANIGLNLTTYLAGFLIFSAIYVNKWRALQSAPLVALTSFLLAYELLRQSKANSRTVMTYAGVVALIMAQVTWALNYWLLNVLVGGVMLLLIFYIIVGILQAYLTTNLNKAILREYFIVGLFTLLLIVVSIFMNPRQLS